MVSKFSLSADDVDFFFKKKQGMKKTCEKELKFPTFQSIHAWCTVIYMMLLILDPSLVLSMVNSL